jgi:hypothetical protein
MIMKRRFLRLAVLVLTMVTVLIAFGITGTTVGATSPPPSPAPQLDTPKSGDITDTSIRLSWSAPPTRYHFTENLKFGLRCSAALAVAGVLRSLSYKFHYDIIDIT